MVQTCYKVFQIVPKCPKMSQVVPKYPKMSQNAHFRRIVVRTDLFNYELKKLIAKIDFSLFFSKTAWDVCLRPVPNMSVYNENYFYLNISGHEISKA